MNYYNENEPYAAQWLRNLIKAGLIPPGRVDDRSIKDVMPGDLVGYSQCHFFAGLGGWSRALELAGWHPDTPVWTGSCPCQPFSKIGTQKGFSDERHLWPEWFRLIREQRPPVLFGEQIAEAEIWLDKVAFDLEEINYAFGSATLPSCSVDARHRRYRIWFVSYPHREGQENFEGFSSTQATPYGRKASSVVCSNDVEYVRWEIEPEVGKLVDGVPPAMDQLRALGNAIVPQVAAQFIQAVM